MKRPAPQIFDARARQDVLREIDGATFDVVVIGGGINGAGVAHDAALRGFSVLLLEQRDLAFGTSSRSSKLIHGGLRYLEQYELRLVYESSNERATLRKMAPHLVRPLMFALPVYEDDRMPLWMMDVGLWMYDGLSLFKSPMRHVTLRSPKRMLEREPLMHPKGLTGGIIYYDCATDDARLTLENAMAAAELGARVVTGAAVTGVDASSDRPGGARVDFEDGPAGRAGHVLARAVIGCTGPWTDKTRRLAGVQDTVLRPTKGVHVVVPQDRLPVAHANLVLASTDGRAIFAIPWRGRTYIGTTDTDYAGDPATPTVTREDVDYLLRAVNLRFTGPDVVVDDIISTWVGIRPLVRPPEALRESDVPREHRIFTDGRLVTVAGGKLTTYRRMAAEVVDVAAAVVGRAGDKARTDQVRLPGARGLPDSAADFEAWAEAEAAKIPLEPEIAGRLVDVYGVRAAEVAALAAGDAALASRVVADRDVIYAEVVHAVQAELAGSVDDVLVRRTSLALTARGQALDAAERVADVMGDLLGWSKAERRAQVEAYEATVALTRAYRG